MASCSAGPPCLQRLFMVFRFILTPFSNCLPGFLSYYVLYHTLVSQQARQCLRPSLSWKVPPAIRVQSFIHLFCSRFCILYLSEQILRIIWIRRGCNTSAIMQDIASDLPAGEQDLSLELVTRTVVYRSSADGSWLSGGRRLRVKRSITRSQQCVEVLADCVVYRSSRYAKKVCKTLSMIHHMLCSLQRSYLVTRSG